MHLLNPLLPPPSHLLQAGDDSCLVNEIDLHATEVQNHENKFGSRDQARVKK